MRPEPTWASTTARALLGLAVLAALVLAISALSASVILALAEPISSPAGERKPWKTGAIAGFQSEQPGKGARVQGCKGARVQGCTPRHSE